MKNRILVLEDDEDILDIICYILKDKGYEVMSLSEGEKIFEHVREFHPDLVLMDVMLGAMDGRMICSRLKEGADTKSLPVILISASHNLAQVLHREGAPNDFIPNPCPCAWEAIESTTYQKGMFNAEKGDLAVTGFVNFNTANAISSSTLKVEAGQFNTYQVMGMVNLLNEKAKANNQSWYAASEYRYSDSYFDNPQHFKRFNFFSKYHGKLNDNNWLTLTVSTLYSTWKASGQIPESAVNDGTVGFYGAIDPNEGGVTSRTTVNAQLLTTLSNNDIIKNQVYYSRYKFDLHTNFTFYLVNTVNGDEIRQREDRCNTML